MTSIKSAGRMAHWREQRELLLDGYFAEHVAAEMTEKSLCWRKPGTGINAITYRVFPGLLVVTGDLGDAIYGAGIPPVFREWAKCDLSYLASKCVASETGRGYREWDRDFALANGTDRWFRHEEWPGQQEKLEELEWQDALSSEIEWTLWLQQNAEDVWGGNWMDQEPWSIGTVISMRCALHLRGLRLACGGRP